MEQGLKIQGEGWYGVYAPARTPLATVDHLSAIIQAWLHLPETRQRILGFGATPTGTTPEQFRSIHAGDRDRWAPAVRASGFKPSD